MRIAVVSGSFKAGWGYQENFLAAEMARLNHEVLVVGATRGPDSVRDVQIDGAKYKLRQVKTVILSSALYLTGGVGRALREFRPELILWPGVGQYFGRDVLTEPSVRNVPVITFFSENTDMHEFDWRRRDTTPRQRLRALGWRISRGEIIRRACRRSTVVVGNFPQTRGILLSLFADERERRRIDEKILDMPLGFDPRIYGWQPEVRSRVRRELGFPEDAVVVCASSRFSSGKGPLLTMILRGIQHALGQCDRLHAVVIGFDDGDTSRRLAAVIDSGPRPDRFVKEPFADQGRLCQLYNAADIVVFGQATVSCQSALGTGLTTCMADTGTMNHLVKGFEHARFFGRMDSEDLSRNLVEQCGILERYAEFERREQRKRQAQASRWLGYDKIVDVVMRQAMRRASEAFGSHGRLELSTCELR